MPFSAIYLGSLAVWQEVGSRHTGLDIPYPCLLCGGGLSLGIDKFFPMPHRRPLRAFGAGAEPMHSEGLNYFPLSRELDIRDGVPAFGLFSPNHRGDYLGIKCTDRTTFLLTWLGPDADLNLSCIADYRLQVSRLGEMGDLRSNKAVYRRVYDQLKLTRHGDISCTHLRRTRSAAL